MADTERRTMRKALVTALTLLSCVGMLACGGDSSSLEDYLKEPTKKPSSSSTSNNNKNDNSDNTQGSFWESYGNESEGTKENPLFSFQVTEEGETCQFPCWYVEIEDTEEHEWICTEYDDEIVQPGKLVSIEGDDKVLLVYNDTSEPREALYCIVVGIRYTKDYFELIDPAWGIQDVKLPENLKAMTATKADIISAYGTPTKVGAEGSYEVLTYEAGKNKYATLYLENDVLCEFELCNLDKPANNLAMSTDALYSFAFSIDGENFQLPLTCEELVQRGWTPDIDIYSKQVSFHEGVRIVWKKNDTYIVTESIKEDMKEEEYGLASEGIIYGIRIGNENWNSYMTVPELNESKTDFRLPEDIQLFHANRGDILGAYGRPTKEVHGDGGHRYLVYDLEDETKLEDDYAWGVVMLVFDEDTESILTYLEAAVMPLWFISGGSEAK